MHANQDRLLIVDDEKDIAKYLAAVGRRLGFATRIVTCDSEFLHALSKFSPTTILLDLQMPGIDGIEFLKLLDKRHCDARVILVSGVDGRTLSTAAELGQFLGLNIAATLPKPVLINDLKGELTKAKHTRGDLTVDELQSGIELGQIQAYYQPKAVRDTSGVWQLTEAEALARWHRDDSDVVMPGDFIPIAEEADLLRDLTLCIIEQVIRQMVEWDKRGLLLSVSVNLSPSMITDETFPDHLESLMQTSGIVNSRLILEITETAVMNYTAVSMGVLSRLRIKGFGLAIDDFGTGYSSLEQLYRLPFNELKIDTSFVRDCEDNQSARTIVEATVMLAHKLGLIVCAEGVESRQILEFLENLGCNKAQGYYIGHPLRAGEFELRVRESTAVKADFVAAR